MVTFGNFDSIIGLAESAKFESCNKFRLIFKWT